MSDFEKLIREFTSRRKIKTADWLVTETDEVLMIRDIPDRNHAMSLEAFLTESGLSSTVAMGNKAGTSWAVMARRPSSPPLLDGYE